uniref:Uncharacterized protein n=1 Tax=Brassica campestris TaxID=3711 RepID=A0A3P6A9P5_BRACM|nr:unnamed protein product [Brassica rapa]
MNQKSFGQSTVLTNQKMTLPPKQRTSMSCFTIFL